MDYLLIALAYSLPYLMGFGAALVLVVIGALAWNHRLLPALAYLAVFFTFSSSRYGALAANASTIYTRGTGQVFFPLLLWMLLLGAIWMAFANASRLRPLGATLVAPPATTIQRWLLLWFLLLVAHICVGVLLDQPLAEILDSNGFIQVPVLGLLVSLLVSGAEAPRANRAMALFIEFSALLKALFGLVRWAAFGGDPTNVYANVEKLAVKLTFFEIGDSLVCLLGMSVAVSMLFLHKDPAASRWRQVLHWAVLTLGLATVVLSFRRTAWLGLLLSFAWLLWQLKPAQRMAALSLAAPVLVAAIGFVAVKRLGSQTSKLGLMGLFYDLMGSKTGGEGARVLELRLAANEFFASPIWGNGAWGRYAATTLIGWQDPTRPGNFLHSGLLHLAMKTGLIGLMLLGGLLHSVVARIRSLQPADASARALLAASCMGLLFMAPDFLAGTPTVQFRTMQLIGVCLALPFFVARAQHVARAVS